MGRWARMTVVLALTGAVLAGTAGPAAAAPGSPTVGCWFITGAGVVPYPNGDVGGNIAVYCQAATTTVVVRSASIRVTLTEGHRHATAFRTGRDVTYFGVSVTLPCQVGATPQMWATARVVLPDRTVRWVSSQRVGSAVGGPIACTV